MKNFLFSIILVFSSLQLFSQVGEVPKEKPKKVDINLLDTDSRFTLDTCSIEKTFCFKPGKIHPIEMTLNSRGKKVRVTPRLYRFKKNGSKKVIWTGTSFVSDATRGRSGKARNTFDVNLRRVRHKGRAYLAFKVESVGNGGIRNSGGRPTKLKKPGSSKMPGNLQVKAKNNKPAGRILPLLVCIDKKCRNCECRENSKPSTKVKPANKLKPRN